MCAYPAVRCWLDCALRRADSQTVRDRSERMQEQNISLEWLTQDKLRIAATQDQCLVLVANKVALDLWQSDKTRFACLVIVLRRVAANCLRNSFVIRHISCAYAKNPQQKLSDLHNL